MNSSVVYDRTKNMNCILKNTHKRRNIDLLRTRDYYFDRARRLNRLKIALAVLPPIILVVSYIVASCAKWIDESRDFIVGGFSILTFLLSYFIIEKGISYNLDKSNRYREEYDLNVFGLTANPFATERIPESDPLSEAKRVKLAPKYETWYGEVFCNNKGRNIICCQLDNVIYTYHVYRACRVLISVILPLVVIGLFLTLIAGVKICILSVLSAFTILQLCVESIGGMTDGINANRAIMKFCESSSREICQQLDCGEYAVLRMLQDVILQNRTHSIFIPKFIRKQFLKEDSIFYRDLDKFKKIYFESAEPSIPSSAEEIELFDPDDHISVRLTEVHNRLLEMLRDVCTLFEQEKITYTLDGGTLIGAVRDENAEQPASTIRTEGGKMIFWDDDVDLAVPYYDVERAKNIIREHLPQYAVQDYSDEFYSPRLSNFRIRDKRSVTCEKDNPLYELYTSRGLFLDIYAYTPIFYGKTLDRCFRNILIHPLYRRIRRTEECYPRVKGVEKKEEALLQRFKRQKQKYQKRVAYYLAHANCNKYYVYTPYYIDNLKKAGPYIRKEDLYGSPRYAEFEGFMLPVPSYPDRILEKSYPAWYCSPFESEEQLRKQFGEKWFSHHQFRSTVMKHIDKVRFLNNDIK